MIPVEYIKMLRKFDQEIPSEEAAVAYIRNAMAEARLLVCRKCGSPNVEPCEERTVKCRECGRKSWFTSETGFHGAKKLRPLLGLIFFQKHDLPLSSNRASILLGATQSTAWEMLNKLKIIMAEDLKYDLNELILMPCEALVAVIRKRSRETPCRQHPVAEIDSFNSERRQQQTAGAGQSAEDGKTSESTQASGAGKEACAQQSHAKTRILEALSESSFPMHIDKLLEMTRIQLNELLLQLTYLQLEGLVVSHNGNTFSMNKTKAACLKVAHNSKPALSLDIVETNVSDFISFCHKFFHGVSRKYLQLYVYQFACMKIEKRENWNALVIGILRCENIRYKDILAYVSPPEISFPIQEAPPLDAQGDGLIHLPAS